MQKCDTRKVLLELESLLGHLFLDTKCVLSFAREAPSFLLVVPWTLTLRFSIPNYSGGNGQIPGNVSCLASFPSSSHSKALLSIYSLPSFLLHLWLTIYFLNSVCCCWFGAIRCCATHTTSTGQVRTMGL